MAATASMEGAEPHVDHGKGRQHSSPSFLPLNSRSRPKDIQDNRQSIPFHLLHHCFRVPNISSERHMSSSSSPYAHPRETTTLVGTDAQDYRDSPLKPAPLRIPSKTRPSTPKIVTQGIAGSSSRLSLSQQDGHYSATTPVHHAPVRTTASSLAGLVSKFEILDAMTSVSGKAPVPPPHRTHGSIGTPSPEVSPPTESHVDLLQSLEDHRVSMRKPSSGSISPLARGSHSAGE